MKKILALVAAVVFSAGVFALNTDTAEAGNGLAPRVGTGNGL